MKSKPLQVFLQVSFLALTVVASIMMVAITTPKDELGMRLEWSQPQQAATKIR